MANNANPAPPAPTSAPSTNRWPMVVLWLGTLLILIIAAVYVFKACIQIPEKVVQTTGQRVKDILETLKKEHVITTTLSSYTTSISNTHYLQFTTLKQQEIFRRSEQFTTAFGYIALPEVVVEARAPIDYTYYLDLNAKWRLELRDGVLYVFAPPIQFNKPAIDASAITYEVRKDYPLSKKAEVMDNLKKSLTSLAQIRARENIPLVRENGRRQAAEFVEKWVLNNSPDAKTYPVKVYFPDEPPPAIVPAQRAPLN